MEAWFANHCHEQRERVEGLLVQVDAKERKLTRAAAMRELEEAGSAADSTGRDDRACAFTDVGLRVPEPLDPALVEQVRKSVAVASSSMRGSC